MNVCPKCGTHKLQEVREEIDDGGGPIGSILLGYECLECGVAIFCCPQCGVPEGERHAAWCPDTLERTGC